MFTPSQCLACGTHKDPGGFVDLIVDRPPDGRRYLCANCVQAAARTLGHVGPEVVAEWKNRIAAATAERDALLAKLDEERENKVVKLNDVLRIVEGRRGPGRPPKDVA